MGARPAPALREIALAFLKLGSTSFGGPASGLSMMEEEFSRRRGWIPEKRFAEMLTLVKLLPGPVASQLAIWIGRERGGVAGGIVAGLSFILPAFAMILLLGGLYEASRSSQALWDPLLKGMHAAALATILGTTVSLFRPYRSQPGAWAIGIVSAIGVVLFPRAEPLIILGFGFSGAWLSLRQSRSHVAEAGFALLTLFWICFKAASLTFGTGLAVLPVLESDLVLRLGWIDHDQFLAAVALGQITPGPLLISATSLGQMLGGLRGALIATAGVFLPGFLLILGIIPHLHRRLANAPGTQGFTRWAIPAVAGVILGASGRIGAAALQSTSTILLFALSAALVFRLRVPAWLLIPGAGIAHLLYARIP